MKHFKKNLRMLRDLEENDPCSNAVKQEEPLLSPSPKVEEGEHAYTYPKDEHLPAESIYWYYASSPFFFHQSQWFRAISAALYPIFMSHETILICSSIKANVVLFSREMLFLKGISEILYLFFILSNLSQKFAPTMYSINMKKVELQCDRIILAYILNLYLQ